MDGAAAITIGLKRPRQSLPHRPHFLRQCRFAGRPSHRSGFSGRVLCGISVRRFLRVSKAPRSTGEGSETLTGSSGHKRASGWSPRAALSVVRQLHVSSEVHTGTAQAYKILCHRGGGQNVTWPERHILLSAAAYWTNPLAASEVADLSAR